MRVILNEQEKLASLNENIFSENTLLQSQKMEALGILSCGIAHDFNNILTAIIGYTELSLAEVPSDSRIKQNLWEILKAGRRAKELVNQILKFRRESEQGKKIIQLVPLIKEVYKLLQVSLPANIEVQLQIEDDSCLIEANPTHIYQILMNLCTNAMHAIGDKHGLLEIKISSCHSDKFVAEKDIALKPGPYVCLSVRDTGIGISPEIIGRIFDPDFTTKKIGEGHGLGLSIVQGLVKNHKGTICVFSEPGQGSIFQIYLPAIDHKGAGDNRI